MKSKILILLMLFGLVAGHAQNVPNSVPVYLDAVWNAVKNHAPSTTFDINSCLANARADYYDPAYNNNSYAVPNSLLRFRNYGPKWSITITSISNLTATGFTANVSINNPLNENVTSRGIVYSTTSNPSYPTNAHASGNGSAPFSVNSGTLTAGTFYYVKAYALINGSSFRYSDQVTVTTPQICPAIGDVYGGGIVAYIYQSGDPGYVAGECHGIIAQPTDIYNGTIDWGCDYDALGTSTALGSGMANTQLIVNDCASSTAALLCYNSTFGGQSDWVLPSRDDVSKLCENKDLIGGFRTTPDCGYMSSSEYGGNYWRVAFCSSCGYSHLGKMSNNANVRAVRYF